MPKRKTENDSSTAVLEPENMSDITAVSMAELEQDRRRWVALVKESAENNQPIPHASILMRYGIAQGIAADLEICRREFTNDVKAMREFRTAEKMFEKRKATREEFVAEHGSRKDLEDQLESLNQSSLEIKKLLHAFDQSERLLGGAMATLRKTTFQASRILDQ